MKYFWWCAAGLLSVGVPYAVAADPFDQWNALTAGTIGGSLYTSALYIAHWRKFASATERNIAGLAVVLLIAGSSLQLYKQQQISQLQRENLRVIRTSIGEGIIVADKIYGPLLPILSAYHAQRNGVRKSISKVFRQRYAQDLSDGTFNQYPRYPDNPMVMDAVTIVTFPHDTLVQLQCIDSIAVGRDLRFRNANGQTGKLEFSATLTPEGISYERRN
jgi:hypothetical protein